MADKQTGREALVTHGVHRNESVVFIELTQGRHAIADATVWPRIVREYGRRWNYLSSGNGFGYARKQVKNDAGGGYYVTLQRAVMGAEPGDRVEVQNGDPLDCRRSNLRSLKTVAATKRKREYAEKRAAHQRAQYDAARERHDRETGGPERRRRHRQGKARLASNRRATGSAFHVWR